MSIACGESQPMNADNDDTYEWWHNELSRANVPVLHRWNVTIQTKFPKPNAPFISFKNRFTCTAAPQTVTVSLRGNRKLCVEHIVKHAFGISHFCRRARALPCECADKSNEDKEDGISRIGSHFIGTMVYFWAVNRYCGQWKQFNVIIELLNLGQKTFSSSNLNWKFMCPRLKSVAARVREWVSHFSYRFSFPINCVRRIRRRWHFTRSHEY